ncbi:MAG: fructosamine kinase family protein [Burkholderiales bacterium]|nr:fructosamine kinase family protein [Burkholderiales bacterium]
MNPAEGAALAAAIGEATGESFALRSLEPVGGGCIHTALRVEGDTSDAHRTYFAKLDTAERGAMFVAEADGLAALRDAKAIAVPGVIAAGSDANRAWLVLEWLDLVPLDARSAAALGKALAALHRQPCERFGWARDNFIGASPQVNGWSDEWHPFWRDRRLHPQLRLAAHNGLPSRLIDRGERLAADCGAFFRTYRPRPSLLHGDLWSGNASATKAGLPIVFDPAVYAGDREADLAMTELFGGFPRELLAAYRTDFALDDGYTVRRDLYNLYHVLNHANLFGGSHVGQASKNVERLLAEIG